MAMALPGGYFIMVRELESRQLQQRHSDEMRFGADTPSWLSIPARLLARVNPPCHYKRTLPHHHTGFDRCFLSQPSLLITNTFLFETKHLIICNPPLATKSQTPTLQAPPTNVEHFRDDGVLVHLAAEKVSPIIPSSSVVAQWTSLAMV